MTIVMLHNRFGVNARGGAEAWLRRQAQEFRCQGARVFILVCDQYGAHFFQNVHAHSDDATDVFRLPVINLTPYQHLHRLPWLARFVWHGLDLVNIPAAIHLARWLKQIKPDRIITHNITGCGWLIRWAIQFSNPNTRWTHALHDIQLLHPSGLLLWGQEKTPTYAGALGRMYRLVTEWLVRPDEVIALSQWIKNEHERWGFFKNANIRIITRAPIIFVQRATSNNPLRLLYVGQLEPHKGVLVLLNSLPIITQPHHITIVGDGSLYKNVQVFMSEQKNCVATGYKNSQEVEQLLQRSDILVVPSICYENTPMIIQEAMATGIAIIASRIGGIPELLENYPRAVLVTPGDPTVLARAIDTCINDHTGTLQSSPHL